MEAYGKYEDAKQHLERQLNTHLHLSPNKNIVEGDFTHSRGDGDDARDIEFMGMRVGGERGER